MISVIGATLKKLRDDAHDAALSPDGSQIVFRDSTAPGIWIMGADGGQAKLFYEPEQGYHVFYPVWFAGGKRIAYLKYKITNGEATVDVESRDHNGGSPVVLLSNPRLSDFYLGENGGLICDISDPTPT